MNGLRPPVPPRSSSKLPEVQSSQQGGALNIPDIVRNPKSHDTTVRAEAARSIMGADGCTAVEYTFAATQIMKDLDNHNTYEIVKSINFVIRNHGFFTDVQFFFAVKKMVNYHSYYSEQLEKGLLKANTPQFSNGDIQQAAQVFINKNAGFFTASPEDVAQFLSFAKTGVSDKTDVVNAYRDSLFELLCSLSIEEKALDLWKSGKFAGVAALSVEVSLFILRNMNHEAITLWNSFALSGAGSQQVGIPNLY